MAKTVIGLIDTPQETQSVVQDLMRNGFARDRIGLMASDKSTKTTGKRSSKKAKDGDAASGAMAGAGAGAALGGIAGLALSFVPLAIPGIGPILAAGPIAAALAGAGVGAVAGGLIGGLTNMGVPEDEAHYYAEGVRRGGTLVTVTTENEREVDIAVDTMKRHGAVDIEERAASWKKQGWGGRFEARETGEDTIPVVEEDLVVGKRQASKGGVRVYSHVVEKPVQQTVNLREEHATIERRPVDRPVQAGDDAFRDQTIEVRESAEEPVVGKRSRVVEEVSVGKEQSEHEETISDTVRRTDVNVERTGDTRGNWSGTERRQAASTNYTGVERRRLA